MASSGRPWRWAMSASASAWSRRPACVSSSAARASSKRPSAISVPGFAIWAVAGMLAAKVEAKVRALSAPVLPMMVCLWPPARIGPGYASRVSNPWQGFAVNSPGQRLRRDVSALQRTVEPELSSRNAHAPGRLRRHARAATVERPGARRAGAVAGGHLPAGLDARRAARTRGEQKPQRADIALGRAGFGGEMQPADRGQRGRAGQVGDDEGDAARAQSLFHRPKHVLVAPGGDEEEAGGVDEAHDAFGVE